jgi:DNA methylase
MMRYAEKTWLLQTRRVTRYVSGLGAVKHEDFTMACGEMTEAQFEAFLRASLGHAAAYSVDGSIHFVCMRWSQMREMLAAASDVYAEQKNLCVWTKTNGGMGSLYRGAHELVGVFKKGTAPHINNIELGRFGRNRTNVWSYPGQNSFNGSAKSKLSLHPTAKPVALVADAIRDCSHRNGIVLDPFGGVGATLIAAEKTGRKARLIELDPRYVDGTVKRWETLTGGRAVKIDADRPRAEVVRRFGDDAPASNDASASVSNGASS